MTTIGMGGRAGGDPTGCGWLIVTVVLVAVVVAGFVALGVWALKDAL